jgi:hypothetical protein
MNELEKSRKDRLRACERALAEHMEEFVKVGLALREIRDDKLYREDGYETFEDYCKQKWELSYAYAYKVIEAADLRLKLSDTLTTCQGEVTESQMRQLGRLGSDSKAKAVAQRVVKEVKEKKARGEKVKLGSVVRKHVDKALGVERGPKKQEELPDFAEVVGKWLGQIQGFADVIEKLADDTLRRFGADQPKLTKDFAAAVARLEKAWHVAGPDGNRTAKVVEVA